MAKKKLDIAQLKVFSPLDGLKTDNLHALLKKLKLERLKHGKTLFKEGDTQKCSLYVLSGTIELREGDEVVKTITGGTTAARNPIAPRLPRQHTAVAAGVVEYIKIDSELLDVMLTWDQTGSYEVGEVDGDEKKGKDDWMTTILQIRAFQQIPPANIQAIFMRLQEVSFSAGQAIIKQGEVGDYFYVITQGHVLVTRETPLNKEGIQLAQLVAGDTFGEEALISEAKRNATVTMQVDGTLMRLGKDDFQTLLKEPLLEWLDHDDAEQAVADGGLWLDVRLPSEFEAFHKDGAVNVPLYFLRLKLDTLDPKLKYVVCCDTGRRSSAAAFILNENNFQTVVLKGGLNQGRLEDS